MYTIIRKLVIESLRHPFFSITYFFMLNITLSFKLDKQFHGTANEAV